ncbi:MAG: pentapeptide repeat-containing protein [Anaerolineales bacterium]|nr:pentapeptide repeat-containing protein [Anaerolineales bacterium]
MKQGWKYLLYASIIVGGFILFETIQLKNTGFEGKALWDWMELLIIPAVLAGGAFFLNRSERALERKIADDRIKEDRRIAEEHEKLERELAIDQYQEVGLQTYIDKMTELFLKENLGDTKDSKIKTVARIRTLTTLRRLDSRRKGLVLRFLQEANLIGKNNLIVDLAGADLHGAILHGANLENVDLQSVDLRGADFHSNVLTNANLQSSNFDGANLNFAFLSRCQLMSANLSNANLHHAYLKDADLQYAVLINADLGLADLQGANLEGASLDGVNLEKANLKGATMPDGTIHE